MDLTRRQFNRGAAMTAGAAAMPPIPVSMRSGGTDAYEAILTEFFRVEEAAHLAGSMPSGGGAVSVAGRHLEGFIAHMDMTVSPFESSAQVYRELRGHIERKARDAAEHAAGRTRNIVEDGIKDSALPDNEPGVGEDEPEDASAPTSTSQAS